MVVRYVDVGAANYTLEQGWFNGSQNLIVHLFEPGEAAAEALRNLPPVPRVTNIVHQVALASRVEERDLLICRKPEVSSFLRPNLKVLSQFPEVERFDVIDSAKIECQPLDNVALDGPIDFIKLDVQGFELEVLKGAERVLSEALVVQLEVEFVEMYESQPLFSEVWRFLDQCGFQFFDFSTIYRYGRKALGTRKGQALAADAVFVSKETPERLRAQTTELRATTNAIAHGLGISEINHIFE